MIGEAIMTLNLNERVEVNDDPNRIAEKNMTKDGKIVFGPLLDWDTDDDEELSHEDIVRILADIDEHKRQNPPELPTLEEAIKESEKYYSSIPMFDYGTGKMSNQQAMADFYGWAIVCQILEEIEYSYNHRLEDQPPGHIKKKLWQRIKDIRAGRLPKADPIKYENKCKGLKPQSESLSAVVVVAVENEPEE
jgi:hypothetical protein